MDLLHKALAREPLSAKELSKLYDYDIFTLGEAAQNIRAQLYDTKVFFNNNRHINPSNICADVCKFCAFSASRKNPNPYSMSIDEILTLAQQAYNNGAKEIHSSWRFGKSRCRFYARRRSRDF